MARVQLSILLATLAFVFHYVTSAAAPISEPEEHKKAAFLSHLGTILIVQAACPWLAQQASKTGWQYGCYCGLGNRCTVVQDPVDQCCSEHDKCFDPNGFLPDECDNAFKECLVKNCPRSTTEVQVEEGNTTTMIMSTKVTTTEPLPTEAPTEPPTTKPSTEPQLTTKAPTPSQSSLTTVDPALGQENTSPKYGRDSGASAQAAAVMMIGVVIIGMLNGRS